MDLNKIYNENCLETIARMPDNFIDLTVTSPPYYGLRDYGHKDQIGLEETPELYVQKLVEVFREVKRVLKSDGTLWLNLGDTYYNYRGANDFSSKQTIAKNEAHKMNSASGKRNSILPNLKGKDLIGIPWMVAFALRADGWYLRQDIIWHKPNPMPESVTDRCTKCHEYIFLMSKSPMYYYDYESVLEPCVDQNRINFQSGTRSNGVNEDRNDNDLGERSKNWKPKTVHKGAITPGQTPQGKALRRMNGEKDDDYIVRNKRDVWTVNTKPYKEAHFATFPEDLIIPCIKAGSREGGIVYDPFSGAGTTALVSHKLNRKFIGSEINPEYVKIAEKRIAPYLMQQTLEFTP